MSRPITIQFYRPRSRAERIRARVLEGLLIVGGGLIGLACLTAFLWLLFLLEVR